ncbi:hypothetical protein JTB14_019833 [Gonioctena quinquepunctata]|nr:hypothetical protein JTB14_019833 [Gonioctena quinquepunctata]
MDLEIDGKLRENLKPIEDSDSAQSSGSFKITTEQGDTVTCRHLTDKKIVPKNTNKYKNNEEYRDMIEQVGERVIFSNEEDLQEKLSRNDESNCDELPNARMNVRELLAKLPRREIERSDNKDRDQMNSLLEQIQKMKKGIERLQEIAQQFKCSEKFKHDIEFLMKNVAPALEKSESKQNDLTRAKS